MLVGGGYRFLRWFFIFRVLAKAILRVRGFARLRSNAVAKGE